MLKKYQLPFLVLLLVIISLPLFILNLKKPQGPKKSTASEEDTVLTTNNLPEPNQIIVKFKEGVTESEKRNFYSRHALQKREDLPLNDIHTLGTEGRNLNEVVSQLSSDPEVEYAEPDYPKTIFFTPNDPLFSKQWWLTKIQAPQAWDITKGKTSIKVAVLDTGISNTHPDLSSKVIIYQNFTGSSAYDKAGHGTHTAGIIGAITNNALGVSGTADVSIMSVKVVGDDGRANSSKFAEGVRWAANNGANIINASLGGPDASTTEKDAIKYAISKGVLIVAAAGNESTNQKMYPAAFDGVIAVAATGESDIKTNFSNYGTWVDIAAPGDGIWSTGYPDKYGGGRGTSYSSPIVAGVAALVKASYPNYTATQITDRLCQTADKISGTGTNWQCGRVNAYKAVLGGIGPSNPPTTKPSSSPQPTLPPQEGLILKLRFQGINEKANNQLVNIVISGGTQNYSSRKIMSQSDDQGLYLTTIGSEISVGTYEMKIKGSSSLQRKIQNIVYTGGTQTIDLTKLENQMLKAGDANTDNKITIEDFSKVSSYYTNFSIPVDSTNTQMEAADVNKDGFITIQDLALIAINWQDFTVWGDN